MEMRGPLLSFVLTVGMTAPACRDRGTVATPDPPPSTDVVKKASPPAPTGDPPLRSLADVADHGPSVVVEGPLRVVHRSAAVWAGPRFAVELDGGHVVLAGAYDDLKMDLEDAVGREVALAGRLAPVPHHDAPLFDGAPDAGPSIQPLGAIGNVSRTGGGAAVTTAAALKKRRRRDPVQIEGQLERVPSSKGFYLALPDGGLRVQVVAEAVMSTDALVGKKVLAQGHLIADATAINPGDHPELRLAPSVFLGQPRLIPAD